MKAHSIHKNYHKKSFMKDPLNFKIIPPKGTWIVYFIHIGNKKYVGMTGDFKNRMHSHRVCIDGACRDLRKSFFNPYMTLDRKEIVSNGFCFSIAKKANTRKEAVCWESFYIRKYKKKGMLINKQGVRELNFAENFIKKLSENIHLLSKKEKNSIVSIINRYK